MSSAAVLNHPLPSFFARPQTSRRSLPPQVAPLKEDRDRVLESPEFVAAQAKQPFDAFLVLDVEATCMQCTDFQWPNEIIEWPVSLLKWTDKGRNGYASSLQPVEEFRSFVRPTWRPTLSQFCADLTGITQEQVDAAPTFPQVLSSFSHFLAKNGLIHPQTGRRLVRFCWCTDGPFDIRDFVVKQCFISNIRMPYWLEGDVMDVRTMVAEWSRPKRIPLTRRMSPNIPMQLRSLGLAPFEGRQHSGIDDTRNIARIVTELARRGVRLYPNTTIHPNRRWYWMGKKGQILEEFFPPLS
ncbi:ribonuclease H-like domain-containing protein [Amylostereum chailletii]|nr:ribonuclease H-like domain-containing protein [Amylostereum chailletii]